MLRSYRTDYLLWAVLAGGVFVALGFADVFPVGSRLGPGPRPGRRELRLLDRGPW